MTSMQTPKVWDWVRYEHGGVMNVSVVTATYPQGRNYPRLIELDKTRYREENEILEIRPPQPGK